MVICKKCQIEYEDDKKFCSQCGSFLFRREESFSEPGDPGQTEEEKPKEKYICPGCKIIFEKSRSCIRCGMEVVPLASLPADEEPEKTVEISIEKEPPTHETISRKQVEAPPQLYICPICKKVHSRGKACIKCGTGLVPYGLPQEKEKTKTSHFNENKKREPKGVVPPEPQEDPFQEGIPDPPAPQMPKGTIEELTKNGKFLRKLRKDYPHMALNWAGISIICIAIGYLIWSIYSYLVPKMPDSILTPPSKETVTPSAPASAVKPLPERSGTEPGDKEGILRLLENIRKANLEKDIPLFMSCYSKDFKDLEGKKKATLENWGNFNFIDLSYDMKTYSISGNVARARVSWMLKFSKKSGGPFQEDQTELDVLFKKEEGLWKIGEIRSPS